MREVLTRPAERQRARGMAAAPHATVKTSRARFLGTPVAQRVLLPSPVWPRAHALAMVLAACGARRPPPRPPRPVTSAPDEGVPPDVPAALRETPLATTAAPNPEAARVADRSRALDALPHPARDASPTPDDVVEPLYQLRATLDAYVVRAVDADRCGRDGANDATVTRCLESGLREVGVVFVDVSPEPPWGAGISVRARSVPGRVGWRTVTSTVHLECGEDARVMLHARGRGALLVEPPERLASAYEARDPTIAWHAQALGRRPSGPLAPTVTDTRVRLARTRGGMREVWWRARVA